ncbi:DNA/RNA non-specific endonuclease [Candidatus Chloroploca asiatica]|uniref:Endonuclease n=1 Tax=Candidatus Chloroploca asiatica TaxID=1506545 RepID=A0A2H3KS41_9CHLR|nr:DNA/RNA non-specific endonuclease [Candidatus Chloroploca asiatica]PDW01430.1 hypothetical protein A9Q02_20850 [Candidatus Chloroploca asiatica]
MKIILAVLSRLTVFLLLMNLLAGCVSGSAQVADASRHLALGNPSGAVVDVRQPTNYLLLRDQYAVGYHRDRGIPNWVSWHLQMSDFGPAERYSGSFITDQSLPEGWYRVTHADYTSSGYDRGHMTPSADRTATEEDNIATFILTNILPQAPDNNRGVWAQLEEYARAVVREGNEAYIIAGSAGSLGTLAQGRLTIPEHVWKVLLFLPEAEGDDATRVTADTMVLAVWMPNDNSVANASWQDYQTTVRCVEDLTGYDFFSAVEPTIQDRIEGQGCPDGKPYRALLPLVVDDELAPPPPVFAGCNVDPGPGVAPERPVRIVTVDKIAETVTLENVSATAINLDGWRMCSIRGGQDHPISGMLESGMTRVFPGPDANIWSNSSSDPGALYDAEGYLISYWPD